MTTFVDTRNVRMGETILPFVVASILGNVMTPNQVECNGYVCIVHVDVENKSIKLTVGKIPVRRSILDIHLLSYLVRLFHCLF